MRVDIAQWIRVTRRLTQAAGYLELDMPQQALARLDNLGPLGPFEADVELLRGEAFRRQQRYDDAARSFEAAKKSRAALRRQSRGTLAVGVPPMILAQAFKRLGRSRRTPPKDRS